MLAFLYRLEYENDTMGYCKNRWLLVILLAQLWLSACSDKKKSSLGNDLLKPIPSNFQTITQAPRKQPETVVVEVEDDTKTAAEKARLDVQTHGDPNITPWSNYGNQPPVLPPPPPTDDDFLSDVLLPPGPGVPYGICGNGIRELNEHCDDMNRDNTDGCNNICEFPFCGNGVTERGEECDDNNVMDGDGCSSCCLFERCGNSRLDPGEQCDDGNKDVDDGCSPCCMFERCGNGIVDPRETCDDGNVVSGDGCSDCCLLEPAARGVVTEEEATPEPNTRF